MNRRFCLLLCVLVTVVSIVGVPTQADDAVRSLDGSAKPGEVTTNSIGMKLVVIPAGEFDMGAAETNGQLEAAGFAISNGFDATSEQPVRRVRITKPFRMGIHEVTLGQFLSFYHAAYKGRLDCEKDGKGGAGYNPSNIGHQFDPEPRYRPWSWGHPSQTYDHPVVNVSWNDCIALCEWLSSKEGKRYRLPTEAEWEYACRGGTTTRFWYGDDPEGVTTVGNVADGTAKGQFYWWTASQSRDGHVFTSPVGAFNRPNPFGLHDMHGNVYEWCSDWFDKNAYAESRGDDPQGPALGSLHVIRGGGWRSLPVDCRSSRRNTGGQSNRNNALGFRVVCELE